jgi:hypothetical protein
MRSGHSAFRVRIRIYLYFDAASALNFCFDAGSDPDWHQNGAYPQTDPTPSLTHVENSETFFKTLFTAIATGLQCFSFLISSIPLGLII